MDEKHPPNEKKVHFRFNLLDSGKETKRWIIVITLISFVLSAFLNFVTSLLQDISVFISSSVVLIIIVINIIFDIIGTAVTAADEAPFHAMASRKLYGARQSIRLIRNADKVSNFCNDVVGDICGVISGAAGTYIIIKIVDMVGALNTESTIIGLAVTGLIASLTVGGKATGKSIAIKNSNYIVYKVSVLIHFLRARFSFMKVKRKSKKS
ncbi:MAG TPA: CNNM domain-containing protein [Clostridia bacterium]|nr:CNNM domain-containing protein [Clostridia bacterium]